MLETSQKLLLSPSARTHTPLGQAEPPGKAVHECQTPCLCLILCCPCRAWQEALWRRAYSHSSSRLRSTGGISRGVFSPGLEDWQDKVGPASRVLGAALGMSADAPQTLIFLGPFWTSLPRISLTMGLASRFQRVSGSECLVASLLPVFFPRLCIYSAIPPLSV